MIQDLSLKKTSIDFSNDSIVVRKFQNGILGGVMLDYSGFNESVILAGHAVITNGEGSYKPMSVNGETYGEMPDGYKYAGVVYRSASITEPVSVMYRGVVNRYKVPYDLKSDFDVKGIILTADMDEQDPYVNYKPIDDISELPTGEDAKASSVNIGRVINDFNSTDYFGNILAADAEVEKNVTLKALGKVILDNVVVSGGKGTTNGKIIYAAKELQIKNITAKEGSTLYNAFEGYQQTDVNYDGLHKLTAENLDIDCPSLTHNIINVYTPVDNAEIIVKNSKFNLTVDNSNVVRMANYLNAENVTITFENCDWTYENGLTKNEWKWAGLLIYQPASSDIALQGDLSKIKTWKFVFKNCRYNGVKITENNFGGHNQAMYLYNVGNTGVVTEPTDMVMVFS